MNTERVMSIMQQDRTMARTIAKEMGFWWLPCPLCGHEFGAHEQVSATGHEFTIPKDWTTDEAGVVELQTATVICPDCTFRGLGCKRHLEIGFDVHEDCEHREAHMRKLRRLP